MKQIPYIALLIHHVPHGGVDEGIIQVEYNSIQRCDFAALLVYVVLTNRNVAESQASDGDLSLTLTSPCSHEETLVGMEEDSRQALSFRIFNFATGL